jgi:hypothetical protein
MQAIGSRLALAAWLVLFLATVSAQAKDYYASPTGGDGSSGTSDNPLSLSKALGYYSPLQPGDTLYLLGGTYQGGFTSNLQGTDGNPITVRQAPGQRATIDCGQSDAGDNRFGIAGKYVHFYDIEVMSSDTNRVLKATGSPEESYRGGVHVRGSNIKLINMVMHDTINGVSSYLGEGNHLEVSGCIIYNNGWSGSDRGHGHGIYLRTDDKLTKTARGNIVFNQFGFGLHTWRDNAGPTQNLTLADNVSFGSGVHHADIDGYSELYIGYGSDTDSIEITGNHFFSLGRSKPAVSLPQSASGNHVGLVMQNNHISGIGLGVELTGWSQATITGNTIRMNGTWQDQYGYHKSSLVEVSSCMTEQEGVTIDNNTYHDTWSNFSPEVASQDAFAAGSSELTFADWQSRTGFDANSSYTRDAPTGIEAYFQPNAYDPNRLDLIVYNFDRTASASLDLSGWLDDGAAYQIRSVFDLYGSPLAEGIFDGSLIDLALGTVDAPLPIGMESSGPVDTAGSEFNVFVITHTPEPATLLILAAGLTGLCRRPRR